MKGALDDVRYAFRKIRREPGFFAFAALIIGVWVAHNKEGGMSNVTSRTSNLRDYRQMNRSFEALTGYMAFFDYSSYNLTGGDQPERLVGVGIAQNFLDVLGVRPLLGRGFVDE